MICCSFYDIISMSSINFEREENQMQKVVILFGKPGAGKGTRLGEFLKGKENLFEVLSVGNLLRKALKNQTELGKKAEIYMNSGGLVPDEIINAIVIDAIRNADKPIITDGYPRTVGQASAMLQAGILPYNVIELYVDDEVVLERAKARIVCNNCGEPYTTNDFKPPKTHGICDKCGSALIRRKDDDENVVKERLKVYKEQTYPVVEFLYKSGVEIYTINNSSSDSQEKFSKLLSH